MQDIYRFIQYGVDENSRSCGRFEATGIRPTAFMYRLESAGVRLTIRPPSGSVTMLTD